MTSFYLRYVGLPGLTGQGVAGPQRGCHPAASARGQLEMESLEMETLLSLA